MSSYLSSFGPCPSGAAGGFLAVGIPNVFPTPVPGVARMPQEREIQEKLKPFAEAIGLRSDYKLYEIYSARVYGADGTNIDELTNAFVTMMPGLFQEDPQAFYFLLKHELAHIRNNDSIKVHTCAAASALSVSLLGLGMFTGFAAAMGAGFLGQVSASRYCEDKADDIAIQHASAAELFGGRRFFWVAQRFQSKCDVFHPSFASRIAKIEKELERRGCNEPEDVSRRISAIVDLFRKNKEVVEGHVKKQGFFNIYKEKMMQIPSAVYAAGKRLVDKISELNEQDRRTQRQMNDLCDQMYAQRHIINPFPMPEQGQG